MLTTKTNEPTTNPEIQVQDTVQTLEPVALDEVNGGWMYSPYAANPYRPYAVNPYRPYAAANPYCGANPYAFARYEAHLARRAAWAAARPLGWWY
jgi:hypothetical protein